MPAWHRLGEPKSTGLVQGIAQQCIIKHATCTDDGLFWHAVAEAIGVCADPEIEVVDLLPSHLFLVLASDGVFEFMSNDDVVQLVRAAPILAMRACQYHAPMPCLIGAAAWLVMW